MKGHRSGGWRKWGLRGLAAMVALGALAAYGTHRLARHSAPPAVTETPPVAAAKPDPVAPPPSAVPADPAPPSSVLPHSTAPQRVEQVFSAEHFGRYTVQVASARGAGLQLIDAMAGPGAEDGEAGQRDGRLDLFLGPGRHKAVMSVAPEETGLPELTVRPFEELHQGALPRLTELAMAQGDLGDGQQRSYWLEISSRRTVFIEAAGRYLADLRLWKDGTWLVDAAPADLPPAGDPGRPLAVRQLAVRLDPGLYRLVAYGGPGQTWTQAGGEKPFALRWGIPTLPETGRRRFVTGPFGFDRWLVPGGATAFRLELPPGEAGLLEVGEFRDGSIIGVSQGAIDKTTRSSAADLGRQGLPVDRRHVVTVHRSAGQPYLLQNYMARRDYVFSPPEDGDYLLSTLRAGRGDDDPDLTALLVRMPDAAEKGGGDKVLASQTIRLGPGQPWRRRFNLLETVELYVEITAAGRYRVEADGVQPDGAQAELQWAPLLTAAGEAKPVPPQAGGGVWDLEAGFYVLTLTPRPERRGILGLSLHGEGAPPADAETPPLPGAAFGPLTLSAKARYRLLVGRQPGPGTGTALRRLPADPAEELPVPLAAGERRDLPLTLSAAGSLRALTEDDQALPLRIDGGTAAEGAPLAAGPHRVELANERAAPVTAALRFSPAAAPPPPALPPLSAAELSKLPAFPELTAGQPRFLDLGVKETAVFAVKVDRPALYRVETTGLLQTAGTLRTQTEPSLATASANGVGRNMLLQQYLGSGLYQLTVSTEEATAGHLGVSLTAAPLRDGGTLSPGIAARASLRGGEGVAYGFDVAAAGPYHLRAFGVRGPTSIRLEDAEGWPLTGPDQDGDLTRDLWPGHYRLVVQPPLLAGRVLTLVEPVVEAPEVSGHGPHALPLDGTAANRWEEPPPGGERRPDVWTFDLPAEADLSITLGDLMQGEIRGEGADRPAAVLSYRQPWRGRLPAGHYHLDLRSLRPNNLLDYTVTTTMTQLVAGFSRAVTAPAVVPVALGGERLTEISSFGSGEVQAVLLDAAGQEVARGGERPDDWNFLISSRLPAGQYRLKLTPLGGDRAETSIRLQELAEQTDAPLAVPGERRIADGLLHSIPLNLQTAEGPLLVAAAQADEPVGLSLERRDGGGEWRAVAGASGRRPRLALPRQSDAAAEYRLQIWSLDHRPQPISLVLRGVAPAMAAETALAGGVALTPLPGVEPPLAVAAVRLAQPGLFRLDQPPSGLLWSAGRGALAHGPDLVVAGGTSLWFLGDPGDGPVRARRVEPDARTPLALTLPAAEEAALPVPETGGAGPRLWVAESRVGQPLLTVGFPNAGKGDAGKFDARSVAVGAGVTAALLPEGAAEGRGAGAVVRLRRADGDGELPLILRQVTFGRPSRGDQGWGEQDLTVEAGAAADLALPDGGKHLRLALPPRTAAALLKDGAVERLLWADREPLAATLDTAAQRLLLLNAADSPGRLSLQLTPVGGGALTLARGGLLRQSLPTAGTLYIDLAVPEAERGLALHLSGPIEDALLVQRDGRLHSGLPSLPVDTAAVLVLHHGPGAVAAWLDGAGGEEERAWLAAAGAAPAQALPATLALAGAEMAWRVTAAAPALLQLSTSVPVLSAAASSAAEAPAPELRVWPRGANLHQFLPAGTDVLVGLRPLQDGGLAGTARLLRSEALAIGEGLGPKTRLAPGDARLFAFTLAEAGAVGVGLRGEADAARMRLLDQGGRVLAEGTVAMADLPAGGYFLLVENRSDAAATEVQPALVGAARPDRGPPEEVRRRYWDLVTADAAEEGH